MSHNISFLIVADCVLRKAEGEIRHKLFIIVRSRSLHALIVGALFAWYRYFLLRVVGVATALLETAYH